MATGRCPWPGPPGSGSGCPAARSPRGSRLRRSPYPLADRTRSRRLGGAQAHDVHGAAGLGDEVLVDPPNTERSPVAPLWFVVALTSTTVPAGGTEPSSSRQRRASVGSRDRPQPGESGPAAGREPLVVLGFDQGSDPNLDRAWCTAGIIGPMTERGLPSADGSPACPFVAFEDDRDARADRPDHRHRCFAEAAPAPRALAHQEAYCLSSAFPVCPTFQDWARREAAHAVPGAVADEEGAEPAAGAPPRSGRPWGTRRTRPRMTCGASPSPNHPSRSGRVAIPRAIGRRHHRGRRGPVGRRRHRRRAWPRGRRSATRRVAELHRIDRRGPGSGRQRGRPTGPRRGSSTRNGRLARLLEGDRLRPRARHRPPIRIWPGWSPRRPTKPRSPSLTSTSARRPRRAAGPRSARHGIAVASENGTANAPRSRLPVTRKARHGRRFAATRPTHRSRRGPGSPVSPASRRSGSWRAESCWRRSSRSSCPASSAWAGAMEARWRRARARRQRSRSPHRSRRHRCRSRRRSSTRSRPVTPCRASRGSSTSRSTRCSQRTRTPSRTRTDPGRGRDHHPLARDRRSPRRSVALRLTAVRRVSAIGARC